ncbi:MAG: radical SAM protein, partial [Nanoarchaeota archaeon]
MTEYRHPDIMFFRGDDGLRGVLWKRYSFTLPAEKTAVLGDYRTEEGAIITCLSEKTTQNKINRLIMEGMARLVSFNRRPTVFIDERIPLIGSNVFGIVDRGTNVIEVKPMTGCNQDCIYCSVDEGASSKKTHDFIVDHTHLAAVFGEVSAIKTHPVEAHIGGQCEPTLYPKLAELIYLLDKIPNVADIVIDTNGQLLTPHYADTLITAGLTRVNLSLNHLDSEAARRIAGGPYNLEVVLKHARELAGRVKLIISPTIIPGHNEDQLEGLIRFAQSLDCPVGIQNFLPYPKGRNPAQGISMDRFF